MFFKVDKLSKFVITGIYAAVYLAGLIKPFHPFDLLSLSSNQVVVDWHALIRSTLSSRQGVRKLRQSKGSGNAVKQQWMY